MVDSWRPVAIKRLAEERRLKVTWENGVVSSYDYDVLRGYCPCAGCQGHMVREVAFRPPPRPVEPVSIEPVGNYAISILWSDRHSTGIYRFEYLRELEERIERASASSASALPPD